MVTYGAAIMRPEAMVAVSYIRPSRLQLIIGAICREATLAGDALMLGLAVFFMVLAVEVLM